MSLLAAVSACVLLGVWGWLGTRKDDPLGLSPIFLYGGVFAGLCITIGYGLARL